jgi:hypothetical protein
MAIIVLLVILGFGVFEWMSANLKIAAMLTAPLLFLVLFFSNTYEVKKGYLTVSTFGKTHQKIWLKDIVKVEVDKTFYDQYNYISIPLGEKTNAFILELKNALPR